MSDTTVPGRATWRKSSRSSASGSNCVEAADLGHLVGVRDSKDRRGSVLSFTHYAWRNFCRNIPASGCESD
ncbi:DUF397 domain-containing protein [Plantactinospora veratri]|uniref:DUF397 domain-containing protein n=1 Tax=Plantactinospora veratri TaxID=1436122 RepID=A0ABU7SH55_9ACTN